MYAQCGHGPYGGPIPGCAASAGVPVPRGGGVGEGEGINGSTRAGAGGGMGGTSSDATEYPQELRLPASRTGCGGGLPRPHQEYVLALVFDALEFVVFVVVFTSVSACAFAARARTGGGVDASLDAGRLGDATRTVGPAQVEGKACV